MAKKKVVSRTTKKTTRKKSAKAATTDSYQHRETKAVARPDVGTQTQFKKKKPPVTYRYDSSLAPELQWDGQNPARELGEQSIADVLAASEELTRLSAELQGDISAEQAKSLAVRLTEVQSQLQEAGEKLRRLGEPFLNWAGKAEQLSFDVPTLPLFVHERLSTEAIIETLTGHKKKTSDNDQQFLFDMFADPEHPITDQILKAYEYQDDWVNRMILGDSLVAMNSLLHYEGLGGQVQMVYIDPPYGVKFGSNFQPFVRKRDVKHGADDAMTREPEMVQAYRDTWKCGVHSYLAYLRDRFVVARELLHASGSIFVQISDENVHHVREVLDEVFGVDSFVAQITVRKTTSDGGNFLGSTSDFILFYARDISRCKYRQLYLPRSTASDERYNQIMMKDGSTRAATQAERDGTSPLPKAARLFRVDNITSSRPAGEGDVKRFEMNGQIFKPGSGTFKTDKNGLQRLNEENRLHVSRNGKLNYRRFQTDFGFGKISNLWHDISGAVQSRSDPKVYAVQTSTSIIKRCMMMTTDPGDLVLDPTCGSGTTAYAAEQWGRRWITMDTSRVPLSLARQRVLTATFPWYELKDAARGPSGGFVYEQKQNKKGQEIGGIVPHVTLRSIANNEPAPEEVFVDRPESESGITRVAGPFCVEATIPTPIDIDGDGESDGLTSHAVEHANFEDRLIEILRRSPTLRLPQNRTVALHNIRKPAKTLSLSAEAMVSASAEGQKPSLPEMADEIREEAEGGFPLSRKPVAFVFGPENGAVSEKLVFEAAREAYGKSYTHLYVVGFAIQPKAREFIENADKMVGVAATYVQATPDLMMGDLLKNMRSSQIFSVCGLPDLKITKNKSKKAPKYQVELLGLDVFDPATLDVDNRPGNDVPAWLLDTNYNDMCFHVCQAFFPRTRAWDSIRKALKGTHDDSVWDHLAGTKSAPFEPGDNKKIAVKVIDDRGNELMVVKDLGEGASK